MYASKQKATQIWVWISHRDCVLACGTNSTLVRARSESSMLINSWNLGCSQTNVDTINSEFRAIRYTNHSVKHWDLSMNSELTVLTVITDATRAL